MADSKENKTIIEEGDVFEGLDVSSLASDVKRKMIGRKVLIKRAFVRAGAEQRSFDCVFLANKKGSKDYTHTFLERETWLAKSLYSKCEKQEV